MDFSQQLKLLKSTYRNNPWWLFDGRSLRILVKNNCSSLDIAMVDFYYHHKVCSGGKKLLGMREIRQLANNSITEIIGLCFGTPPAKYYLFELHKFISNNGVVGFMLVCLEALEHYNHTVFLNYLLFNEIKRVVAITFSEREREILYFIMSGKTYSEISTILSSIHAKGISASCIGKIVRNSLYPKFNVWTKFELRQALLRSEWVRQVPQSIVDYRVKITRRRQNENIA